MTTVFVGGAQRTGTTVLQGILCQAPGTNPMLTEAYYLYWLVKAYARTKSTWELKTKDYFDDTEQLRWFHAKFINEFLDMTASRFPDARHLVLKCPHLTPIFPELFELVGGAKFVVIVRDPRDAIASTVEVGHRLSAEGKKIFFQKRDMAKLSKYFLSFYAPIFADTNPEFRSSTRFIRYEDLVTDPETQLRKVCDFSGLDLESFLSNRSVEGPVSCRIQDLKLTAWQAENYARPLNASAIGRHKTSLDAKEVGEIEERCREFLKVCGYDKSATA